MAATGLLASLAVGCQTTPGASQSGGGPIATRRTSEQLGFKPLLPPAQLYGWNDVRARHALSAVVLDPQGKQALLTFNEPLRWVDPQTGVTPASASRAPGGAAPAAENEQANAVLLDLSAGHSRGLHLPGPYRSVDFAQQQLVGTNPGASADPKYYAYNLADDTTAPLLTPPDDAADPAEAGATPPPPGTLRAEDVGALWTFTPPLNTGSGTGRADSAGHAGSLRLLTDTAKDQSVDTGSLPFTGLAGDARHQRAFLSLDGAGVVLVDLTPGTAQPLRWLIRDSGSAQFFLEQDSSRLVVATDSGLSVIGLDELARLAPQLSAAQALTTQAIRRLKPAAKALGWDWPGVQFNPLGGNAGRLSLLDSSDPNSTTAELDWSPATQRALRVLITRRPLPVDEALRTATPDERTRLVGDLLGKLGWPGAAAQPAPAGSSPVVPEKTDSSGEVQLTWTLDPAATAPRDPGVFSLWLTPEAAIWELRAATAATPAGLMASAEAVSAALQAVEQQASAPAGQTSPAGMSGATGGHPATEKFYAAATPRFGWIDPLAGEASPLLPEGTATLLACYEVDVLQTGTPPLAYRVRVSDPAHSTVEGPHPAGFELLRRARSGEFGPDAARAFALPTSNLAGAPAGQS
jgi:hypothetical protein